LGRIHNEEAENRDEGNTSQHRGECVDNDFEEGLGIRRNGEVMAAAI
jgi:hypothetical protein